MEASKARTYSSHSNHYSVQNSPSLTGPSGPSQQNDPWVDGVFCILRYIWMFDPLSLLMFIDFEPVLCGKPRRRNVRLDASTSRPPGQPRKP